MTSKQRARNPPLEHDAVGEKAILAVPIGKDEKKGWKAGGGFIRKVTDGEEEIERNT
jgi:hypothetical protein